MRIVLIILPWVWIAAGTAILLRTRRRPGAAAQAFALALSAYGLSAFFITPRPVLWLVAWQAACVLAAAAALWLWPRKS